VLAVAPETKVAPWLFAGEAGGAQLSAYPSAADRAKSGALAPKTRTYRAFIESDAARNAVLSVKHGYLDISANGVQLLSADSPYSSDQQVELRLEQGLNMVEIAYRRAGRELPPVHLFDPLGQPLAGVKWASNETELNALAAAWEKTHSDGALHVQSVPNQMRFAPTELHAKAGQPVKIVFENPDLMPHNFVLLASGAEEEVGLLADQMASAPDAAAKSYVPASPKVLQATKLIESKGRAELDFTAPAKVGEYPYVCTFPGHWRVMRGVLVVE
jgi:azurin